MNGHLKPRESAAIIHSLTAGVVPSRGIQHVAVGRSHEIAASLSALEEVKQGQSLVKFWIGEFGSGKSFMLSLLKMVALKQKFVTASVDFTPEKRLYAKDRRGIDTYASLMDNLCTQTRPDGGALPSLLEKWLDGVSMATARELQVSPNEIRDEKHMESVKLNIMKTLDGMTEVGSFDFGMVLLKYFEGYMTGDEQLCKHALKWIKGEYISKLEARKNLGVRSIIDGTNYYDMLKNLCRFFCFIGYSGLMVNFDEADNLYKIPHPQSRDKNYEKILSIYNELEF